MAGHAKLSPSGAHRWINCPGSLALEYDLPDQGSEYAREGTAAHLLLSTCLEHDWDPWGLEGHIIACDDEDGWFTNSVEPVPEGCSTFVVDGEMIRHVQGVIDRAKSFDGQLYPEANLPIDHITGEDGATGTSDIVIISPKEIVVADLKYGRGEQVFAKENDQLLEYGSAAIREHAELIEMLGTTHVRLIIDQPRLNHYDEWVITIDELHQRIEERHKPAAKVAWTALEFKSNWKNDSKSAYLSPSEDACRWCKAKALCPALKTFVADTTGLDFDDLTAPPIAPPDHADDQELSTKMKAVGAIEDWCKAVRAEVERRLLAGVEVPDFKLVRGKKGNRAWGNEDEVEDTMKKMRIKHDMMYKYSLISPTRAEELAKEGVIGEKQWKKLQDAITQADGKLSVAPASDKRDAVKPTLPTADDFEDVSEEVPL